MSRYFPRLAPRNSDSLWSISPSRSLSLRLSLQPHLLEVFRKLGEHIFGLAGRELLFERGKDRQSHPACFLDRRETGLLHHPLVELLAVHLERSSLRLIPCPPHVLEFDWKLGGDLIGFPRRQAIAQGVEDRR